MLNIPRIIRNRTIIRKFATLIIPTPGNPMSDIGSLGIASQQLPQPVDILQIAKENSKDQIINEIGSNIESETVHNIFLRTSNDFIENDYVGSTGLIENFLDENEGKYSHIVLGNNNHAKEVLPRLSISRNCQSVSDVIHVLENDKFQRPIYAGNALATVKVIKNNPNCKIFYFLLQVSFFKKFIILI